MSDGQFIDRGTLDLWSDTMQEQRDTIARLRADLAAVPAQMRVKPLVWDEDTDRDSDDFGRLIATDTNIHVRYKVYRGYGGDWLLSGSVPFWQPRYPTVDAAKAAAQVDYEARILAALEPQPDSRTADYEQAYQYALTLADALRAKHYPDNKDWRPLGDITGLLTQIDNMVAGKKPDPRDEVIAQLVDAATHLCDGIATMLPPLGQSDRVLSLRAAIAAAKAVQK